MIPSNKSTQKPLRPSSAAQGGFVKTIILIVVALLVISYFGLNLRQIVSSPTTQDNFGYAWSQVVRIWNLAKDLVTRTAENTPSNVQGTTTTQ